MVEGPPKPPTPPPRVRLANSPGYSSTMSNPTGSAMSLSLSGSCVECSITRGFPCGRRWRRGRRSSGHDRLGLARDHASEVAHERPVVSGSHGAGVSDGSYHASATGPCRSSRLSYSFTSLAVCGPAFVTTYRYTTVLPRAS